MDDDLAARVPPVVVYSTEFDYYLKGAVEAAELYKKNAKLLDFGVLAGLHHGAHHEWGHIKRA